jgi:putative transposase
MSEEHSMYTNPFTVGKTLFIDNVAYEVVSMVDDRTLQLRNVSTGVLKNEPVYNLLTQYTDGVLKTASDLRREAGLRPSKKREPARMDELTPASKSETRRRIDYLVRLERADAFEGSRKSLELALEEVAKERGDLHPPHVTTVYKWRGNYLKSAKDVRALFVAFGERGGKDKGRLHQEVEAILHQSVEEALESRTWSAEDIQDAVRDEITLKNEARVTSKQLKLPSLRTIQRRLKSVPAFDVAVAKFGVEEAERRFAKMGIARSTKRILELVEIDHTPVDLLVVNEQRVVIGRPMLTVVFDRHSRCVLGYHLSLDGYGTPAVFEALRHALYPKTYLKTKYADLGLEWECFGWFTRLLMDNGREFHAEAVADALTNINIICEYAKPRTPNDKPFVERFLRTFNYCFIHRLPGTTLSKVHKRIGLDSEAEAAITLEELDKMIHVWICERYHRRPHTGLGGKTPIAVWRESANAFPPSLKFNADDIEIEFSESGNSALQHYGIDLNTFQYVSPRLLELRRMLPGRARVDVKWPARDVGHIFVWHPTDREFIKVPNAAQEFHGLSLEQAKAVKSQRAKANPEDAVVRAKAGSVVKGMVDAALADKALKNRRKGARMAGHNSQQSRTADATDTQLDDGLQSEAQCDISSTIAFDTFDMEVPA